MSGAALPAALVLSSLCLALAWHDLRRFLLPDTLTLALAASGLLFAALLDFGGIAHHGIGMLAGYAVFDLVARSYRRLRGRDGLGAGDAKLMAGAGAWVGWQGLPSVVLVGSVLALSATLVAARIRARPLVATTRIPLGAYLALGLWLTWLVGPLGV